ncbi:MAG: metallophosphoesterase [Anaeroplasmataceae bacterium]|nr:metallophosphoesterase [Anaeroplasmataceae bacterium]
MKILVLSDTHSNEIRLDLKKYDFVIHCGDYGKSIDPHTQRDILFVKGNCDIYGPDLLELSIASKKVFVTHGYMENVKYGFDRLIYKALEKNCQICMFGHTHMQVCFLEEGILFLNPGSYPEGYIEIFDEEIVLHQKNTIKKISYRW